MEPFFSFCYAHIMNELNIGAFDCPEIKCGFIGEVGSSYPILGKEPIITYIIK